MSGFKPLHVGGGVGLVVGGLAGVDDGREVGSPFDDGDPVGLGLGVGDKVAKGAGVGRDPIISCRDGIVATVPTVWPRRACCPFTTDIKVQSGMIFIYL